MGNIFRQIRRPVLAVVSRVAYGTSGREPSGDCEFNVWSDNQYNVWSDDQYNCWEVA